MKRSRHALEEKLQLSLYVLNWENIKFKVTCTDRQTDRQTDRNSATHSADRKVT